MQSTQVVVNAGCAVLEKNFLDFSKATATTDEMRESSGGPNNLESSLFDSVEPPQPPANTSNDEQLENMSNAKKGGKKKNKKGPEDEMPQVEARKAFSISTQLYRFGEHLAMYSRLYQESYPQLMCNNTKFYIETENNGVGCLDLLFTAFCDFMKMEKIKNLPTDGGGERIFCWLGKRKATEVLPTLRPAHHFVNRLPLDIYLKDKQSLALTLLRNTLLKGIKLPKHYCPFIGKTVQCQILCRHQYARHSMEPCSEPGCFEELSKEARNEMGINKLHPGTMCPCLQSRIFVPETKVFASSLQQNVFIEDISRTAPEAHWIVKPSYMRSGRGVRILSSAEQLRTFFKVNTSNRFMWGQNYVVQRYIKKPMLTNNGHKFDVRMFLLIVVTKFKRVLGFLHPGYVRKVPDPYKVLEKNEKFHARQHLAGTRLWRTYGPKLDGQPPQASANNASSTERTEKQTATSETTPPESPKTEAEALNLQSQNNAAKKKKKGKDLNQVNPLEPVNLIGFYSGNFADDECEEYNYAIRHGCLKGNKQNLPIILTATDAPLLKPKPPKKQNTNPTEANPASSSASPDAGSTTADTSGATTGNTASESQPAGTASESSMAAEVVNSKAPNTVQFLPPIPDSKDPFAQYSTNHSFLRSLRSMVTNICSSILDQIKDKANCYQLFSLDICIDEEGKPWLLEVNPSVITENVNWNSRTIREVIPGVVVESLALVCETTRKGLSFLALRTPALFGPKPEDLVFRQNFIWLFSMPDKHCDLFELKQQKYAIEKLHKSDMTSRGVSYTPVDYYPEKNKKLIKAVSSEAAKKALDSNASRCTYRFPSPVANIPVLEDDIAFSLRYTRIPMDSIKRQTHGRHLENEAKKHRLLNEEARYKVYWDKKHKPKAMLKERFVLN